MEHGHLKEVNKDLFISQMNDIITAVEGGEVPECTHDVHGEAKSGDKEETTDSSHNPDNASSTDSANEVGISLFAISI